jgi:hypothetical protein
MNRFPLHFLTAIAAVIATSPACGPFFPDTVLDLPQAALRVRATCLLDEMVAIDRSHGLGLSRRPPGLAMIKRTQSDNTIDWSISHDEWLRRENRRLLAPVVAAGMPEAMAETTAFGEETTRVEAIGLAVHLLDNQIVPARVAEIITAFTKWRAALPEVDMDGPWNLPVPPPSQTAAAPEFPEVPRDITAYWQAARQWRGGDVAAARTGWQAILDLPASARRHRGLWAAWMLAKTSPDEATGAAFHQKVIELADGGADDSLGLAALARGWLAMVQTNPVERMKGYFHASCAGDEAMLVSLLAQVQRVVADPEAMARAAADPLAREVLTALVFRGGPNSNADHLVAEHTAWLAALRDHPAAGASPAAAKAAWHCYSAARFDEAREWLKRAPQDAGDVHWLRAKLALRDGHLDEAARWFAKAAPFYQFEEGRRPAPPAYQDMNWYDHGARRDWMRGQFHSDRAITLVGRGEFIRAMDFLARASYDADAAYLAERVLTVDELIGWVRKNRPDPVVLDPKTGVFQLDDRGAPHRPEWGWEGDRFRYLLARRLAREFRFREAAEFMPPALQGAFDHYVRLHRAARESSWPDETKAVILWHLAMMRRHLGMEIFGYDGAPDNTQVDGNYPATDLVQRRMRQDGWRSSWNDEGYAIDAPKETGDFAIPRITREEIQRITPHAATAEKRFHYRYDAAEIAWRAAAMLPDDDPRTLYILHQAGCWLASRDAKAADRFYQAIIRRCKSLPARQEMDKRRWFLPEAPAYPLPPLPKELRPEEKPGLRHVRPDVASAR